MKIINISVTALENGPSNISMYQSFWHQAEHSMEALVEVRYGVKI